MKKAIVHKQAYNNIDLLEHAHIIESKFEVYERAAIVAAEDTENKEALKILGSVVKREIDLLKNKINERRAGDE